MLNFKRFPYQLFSTRYIIKHIDFLWKSSPQCTSPGVGRVKSAGHLNIPQPHLPCPTPPLMTLTLYFLGSSSPVIVRKWKMHFLLSFHHHPFRYLFIALFLIIDFEWCDMLSNVLFCNKDPASPTKHILSLRQCPDPRVNILCWSSDHPISTVRQIRSVALFDHRAVHADHIWIIHSFVPIHPSRPTTSIIQIERNRAWKIRKNKYLTLIANQYIRSAIPSF